MASKVVYTARTGLTIAPEDMPVLFHEGQVIPSEWVSRVPPELVLANGRPLVDRKGQKTAYAEELLAEGSEAVDAITKNVKSSTPDGPKTRPGPQALAKNVLGLGPEKED